MKHKKILSEMSIDELQIQLNFHQQYKSLWPYYLQEIETEILKRKNEMVTLQYFNGNAWVDVSEYVNEKIAWMTLGGDNYNYRVIDGLGNILIQNIGKTVSK